jgi:hypothetical protein
MRHHVRNLALLLTSAAVATLFLPGILATVDGTKADDEAIQRRGAASRARAQAPVVPPVATGHAVQVQRSSAARPAYLNDRVMVRADSAQAFEALAQAHGAVVVRAPGRSG